MKKPEAFEWKLSYRGEEIEDLILTMCLNYPLLMIDVLKLGFGDLDSWFGTGNFRTAKCGCLVGAFAVAAKKQLTTKQIDEVIAEVTTLDGPDPLVPAIKILYKEELSQKFQQDLLDVGSWVASEGYGTRKEPVKSYMLDLIRVNLTLVGFTRLPKSPAIV